MFVTKKTFTDAVSKITEETQSLERFVLAVDSIARVQGATVQRLEAELRKRDAVLVENTRRINALMDFCRLEEVLVPAAPEQHVYVRERS